MKAKVAVISKNGGRKINEDSYGHYKINDYECFLVCDGLGGHSAGEIASKLVSETIIDSFRENPGIDDIKIADYINISQEKLLNAQKENRNQYNMKTTLVLLVSQGPFLKWAHIGDSRLYYFSEGIIKNCTLDHSVPQMLANIGDIKPNEIRYHEDRNKLLRVMGTEWEKPKYEISKEIKKVNKGDVLLLCTDGFWEHITEEEMEYTLEKSRRPEKWLKLMEQKILKRAVNENMDNYTAIAVHIV